MTEETKKTFQYRLDFTAVVNEQTINGIHFVEAPDFVAATALFVDTFGTENAFLVALTNLTEQEFLGDAE